MIYQTVFLFDQASFVFHAHMRAQFDYTDMQSPYSKLLLPVIYYPLVCWTPLGLHGARKVRLHVCDSGGYQPFVMPTLLCSVAVVLKHSYALPSPCFDSPHHI